MAWNTPTTQSAGGTVTAAIWNGQIRDNFKAIGDPWTSYTPTLTASTTNPTLGSGSAAGGGYVSAGKLIIYRFRIVFGTGPTAGSGTYFISLPVNANTASKVGAATVYMFDSSATAVATPTPYIDTTARIGFLYPATWPSGAMTFATHSTPWAWAASDEINGEIVYEAA